jgi:hypothetical protein
VLLAGVIGIPLAFLFARYDLPGGRVLGGLVALPAVLPPLVGVLAFLFLYGETGFVSLLVQRLLGLSEPPWRLQGAGAILLVHAYSMLYFYLFVRPPCSRSTRPDRGGRQPGAGRWRRPPGGATATLSRSAAPRRSPMTALASFGAPYISAIPGRADPDRRHPPQRRRPARDGRDHFLTLVASWHLALRRARAGEARRATEGLSRPGSRCVGGGSDSLWRWWAGG